MAKNNSGTKTTEKTVAVRVTGTEAKIIDGEEYFKKSKMEFANENDAALWLGQQILRHGQEKSIQVRAAGQTWKVVTAQALLNELNGYSSVSEKIKAGMEARAQQLTTSHDDEDEIDEMPILESSELQPTTA